MGQKQFLKSRFFKLPNHKQFDFPARYYDERKEKLDERIKSIYTSDYNKRIKDSFKSKSRTKNWNQNWNTIRLLIIFSILILGFLFIYSQIDSVLEILTNSNSK